MDDPVEIQPDPIDVGVVVLTQGRRPLELHRALASIRRQQGVRLDVVVVGNGWEPTGLPAGVSTVALATNVGIPAGRNAGVDHVHGDLLLFVDDDAALDAPDFLIDVARMFDDDPQLGIVQPRVESPGEDAPTRWIPRMRKGDPRHSSPAFSLWEGVLVVRREAFDAAGGWGAAYFYAHEGIELAWRVWDAGYEVWYRGDVHCVHPAIDPARHATYLHNNARNRVWLARRNLRWPISWMYVASWTAVQVARSVRSPLSLRPWFGGWWAGWRQHPGDRRAMRWSTVWRMTRRGRPPVI
ncbi:MAG: glycosyltransferase family 2 protein [Aeromicrobium sp.]|jgi:GT2 family glycosyltransferase|nr:glycosyltransferase family 2 protein [Aeromicrobium sp.]